jgi:hypothetical protein
MVIFHSYVSLSEGRGISLDFTMLKQQTWCFLIGYPDILCFSSMDHMDHGWSMMGI